MKNRYFIVGIFLVLTTFIGCKNKSVPEPDNLIAKDSIVGMLSDQLVIEASVFFMQPDTADLNRKKPSVALYNDFFLKHHITQEQYRESVGYYFSDSEQAKEIMRNVADTLSARRQRLVKE